MEYFNTHLLSLILFTPAIAALIMLFLPSNNQLQRWFAFSASLIPFIMTLVLWNQFDPNTAGFQFEEKYAWYEAIHSSFHVGVDGSHTAARGLEARRVGLSAEPAKLCGGHPIPEFRGLPSPLEPATPTR